MGVPVAARIVSVPQADGDQSGKELLKIQGSNAGSRWTRAAFLDVNRTLLTSGG